MESQVIDLHTNVCDSYRFLDIKLKFHYVAESMPQESMSGF